VVNVGQRPVYVTQVSFVYGDGQHALIIPEPKFGPPFPKLLGDGEQINSFHNLASVREGETKYGPLKLVLAFGAGGFKFASPVDETMRARPSWRYNVKTWLKVARARRPTALRGAAVHLNLVVLVLAVRPHDRLDQVTNRSHRGTLPDADTCRMIGGRGMDRQAESFGQPRCHRLLFSSLERFRVGNAMDDADIHGGTSDSWFSRSYPRPSPRAQPDGHAT